MDYAGEGAGGVEEFAGYVVCLGCKALAKAHIE